MADWFRCSPLPLLDALQELSEDAQLVFVKTLLLVYHRDGRIPTKALRYRFPNWRPKRLERAVNECLAAGKLIGTATGDLHNERAMHELEQLAALSSERAASGAKGGRVRSQRERLAKKIAERNLSPDLPLNLPETDVERALNSGSTGIEQPLSDDRAPVENSQPTENANAFNDTGQAELNHAPAIETDIELETYIPLGDPPVENTDIELVEGEFMDDDTDRRFRKQPLPPGWLPAKANLSERVQEVVHTWDETEVEDQAIKFLEWAEAAGARFVQWDRAFGNWCMKHDEQRRRTRHGKQSGFKVPTLGS